MLELRNTFLLGLEIALLSHYAPMQISDALTYRYYYTYHTTACDVPTLTARNCEVIIGSEASLSHSPSLSSLAAGSVDEVNEIVFT